MCDRSYPKKLAFQYLEDLKNEFERVNGAQTETAARPYAFIKFGRFCSYPEWIRIVLIDAWCSFTFSLEHLLGLILFSMFMFLRYVHTENKEIVPGHPHPAEYCKVEWWAVWSPPNNDSQCAGCSGCWWKAGP